MTTELTLGDVPLSDQIERKEFEQWYATNAFNFERDPIGSRDCGLQWAAWKARREYGAKHPPTPIYQPRLTPVGCGDGNTYVVG